MGTINLGPQPSAIELSKRLRAAGFDGYADVALAAHWRELALRGALKGLYDSIPRYSCKSNAPDGCPVCVARTVLRGK